MISFLILLFLPASLSAVNQLGHVYVLKPGVAIKNTNIDDFQIYCYKGVPKHILHLWLTVSININLNPEEYDFYIAGTPEEVKQQFELLHSSWTLPLFNWRGKNIKLNPFNRTCIGVNTIHNYDIVLNILRIDFWRVILMATGIFLFFSAPKLSSNPLFYYICGVTLGITTSFLILIYLISKLLPRKPLMYSFIVGGWTIGVYLFQMLWENFRTVAVNYQEHVLGYLTVMGVISFIICYRFGPVTDPRSKNLIKWSLQIAGLLLIFYSSQHQEASLFLVVLIVIYYNFPQSLYAYIVLKWKKQFPPKTKLLSEDEYHEEGARETVKALDELRQYCSSPECNQWKTMLKLKQPLRFAEFMEGKSHLEDSEILEYESNSIKEDEQVTDDSDYEEED